MLTTRTGAVTIVLAVPTQPDGADLRETRRAVVLASGGDPVGLVHRLGPAL